MTGYWSPWITSDEARIQMPEPSDSQSLRTVSRGGGGPYIHSPTYVWPDQPYGEMFDPAILTQAWEAAVASFYTSSENYIGGVVAEWQWEYDSPALNLGHGFPEYWDDYTGDMVAYTTATYDFGPKITQEILYPTRPGFTYEYENTSPQMRFVPPPDLVPDGVVPEGHALFLVQVQGLGVIQFPQLSNQPYVPPEYFLTTDDGYSLKIGDQQYSGLTVAGQDAAQRSTALSWPGATFVAGGTVSENPVQYWTVPVNVMDYLKTHNYRIPLHVETSSGSSPWPIPADLITGEGITGVGNFLWVKLIGELRIRPPRWRYWITDADLSLNAKFPETQSPPASVNVQSRRTAEAARGLGSSTSWRVIGTAEQPFNLRMPDGGWRTFAGGTGPALLQKQTDGSWATVAREGGGVWGPWITPQPFYIGPHPSSRALKSPGDFTGPEYARRGPFPLEASLGRSFDESAVTEALAGASANTAVVDEHDVPGWVWSYSSPGADAPETPDFNDTYDTYYARVIPWCEDTWDFSELQLYDNQRYHNFPTLQYESDRNTITTNDPVDNPYSTPHVFGDFSMSGWAFWDGGVFGNADFDGKALLKITVGDQVNTVQINWTGRGAGVASGWTGDFAVLHSASNSQTNWWSFSFDLLAYLRAHDYKLTMRQEVGLPDPVLPDGFRTGLFNTYYQFFGQAFFQFSVKVQPPRHRALLT